jgi:tetratricopeptide (TPR) repeat protein
MRAGNLDEARRMLESVVQPSRPVYPPARMALAEVQRAQGDVDAAIESCLEVVRIPGYEKDALMKLAELYQQKGDVAAAINALERARNYFPPTDTTIPDMIRRLQAQR